MQQLFYAAYSSISDERPPVPDKFISNPSEGGQFLVDNTALEIIFDTEVKIIHWEYWTDW